MYSTLTYQDNLQKTSFNRFLITYLLKRLIGRDLQCFLLVRNPFSRAESFFKDKFRQGALVNLERRQWQHSQYIFFPYMGIDPTSSAEEINEHLQATTFSEYVATLPHVYLKDRHLHPQIQKRRLAFKKAGLRMKVPIHYDRVIKVECAEDLSELAELLQIDIKTRYNSTKPVSEPIKWSEIERKRIAAIYRDDFETFYYSLDVTKRKDCQHSATEASEMQTS